MLKFEEEKNTLFVLLHVGTTWTQQLALLVKNDGDVSFLQFIMK